MYRIVIAGPDGYYPNCPIDVNAETAAFFTSDQAECFCSEDPAELDGCDGVVIPGGLPDVSPSYWNEEDVACKVVDEEMDRRQMALIDRAIKLGKPIIGFCRGHQLVCVYFGASLIQDIGCKADHCYEPSSARFHKIYNVPGTFMQDLYGDSMKGNSAHHQALKHLPDCLRVSQIWCEDEEKAAEYVAMAQANQLREGTHDCIIEAVYHKEYPFIGLQWHPELCGELYCKHLDLSKITSYFYEMMEKNRGYKGQN
jgi:putative glutamine amidotransferase